MHKAFLADNAEKAKKRRQEEEAERIRAQERAKEKAKGEQGGEDGAAFADGSAEVGAAAAAAYGVAHAEDMKAIWEDPTVRDMLIRKGIRMETTPGLCVHPLPLLFLSPCGVRGG